MSDAFRGFVHRLSFIVDHGCDLPPDPLAQASYFARADTLVVNAPGSADAHACVIPTHCLGTGRVSSFQFRISRRFQHLRGVANPDRINGRRSLKRGAKGVEAEAAQVSRNARRPVRKDQHRAPLLQGLTDSLAKRSARRQGFAVDGINHQRPQQKCHNARQRGQQRGIGNRERRQSGCQEERVHPPGAIRDINSRLASPQSGALEDDAGAAQATQQS